MLRWRSRALVAALRQANARLREVVGAKDAQLAAAQAQIEICAGRADRGPEAPPGQGLLHLVQAAFLRQPV